ncbi:MAG: metalloregulator ArsR/SmtB family transcription factor [Bacteroidota bacterium]
MPDIFKALADTTRRDILLRVAERPTSVNELVDGFSMSRPAISKHLKLLAAAGLVSYQPGTEDGRQRICHAEIRALTELDDYLSKVRTFWNQRLDRLGDFLEEQDQR